MDREERLQALNEIEGQLSQYLAADKKNWIQTYLLLSEVQEKELYVVNYRSFTKWVNHLADSLSIHVSTYRVFEEFAIDPGTSRHSRRLDALIAENISVPPHTDNQVNLIGVEIKVDVNDLKNDCKMQEYTDFVDQFYLAVPDEEDIVNAALSIKLDTWGLIIVSKDGQIKVLQTADKLPAIMRDKTLNSLVLKLL